MESSQEVKISTTVAYSYTNVVSTSSANSTMISARFSTDPSNYSLYNFLPFIIADFTIAAFSIITNGISLSYFIRKRKEKDVRLFMLLNMYDLLVSIVTPVAISAIVLHLRINELMDEADPAVLSSLHQEAHTMFAYTEPVYKSAVLATGMVTAALSIHRIFLIKHPLKSLNTKAPTIALTVIPILLIPAYVLQQKYYDDDKIHVDWCTHVTLSVLIFISIVCNAITVAILLCRKSAHPAGLNRAATTVLILSAVFTVLNICYVVTDSIKWSHLLRSYELTYEYLKEEYTYWGVSLIAPPLNSFLNPLIHFIRSANMRTYLKGLILRIRIFSSPPYGRQTPGKCEVRRIEDNKV